MVAILPRPQCNNLRIKDHLYKFFDEVRSFTWHKSRYETWNIPPMIFLYHIHVNVWHGDWYQTWNIIVIKFLMKFILTPLKTVRIVIQLGKWRVEYQSVLRFCSSDVAHYALQWRHNEDDGVSNDRRLHCFLNRLFRCRSNKTSKLRDTGLYVENQMVTDGFPPTKGK